MVVQSELNDKSRMNREAHKAQQGDTHIKKRHCAVCALSVTQAIKPGPLFYRGLILLTVAYSKVSASNQASSTTLTQQSSTIVAANGNAQIQAGQALSVVASDISAGQNLTLIGKSVDLSAAQNTSVQQGTQQSSASGFSVGVTVNPVAAFQHSGSANSTTYATLTDGNIKIGGQSMTSAASLGAHTDLATANSSIEALPDVKKLMQDQQAMVAAANTVIATASQIVSDKAKVANQQVTDANASIKTANQNIADAQAVLNDNNSTQDQKDAAQAAIVQANLQLGSATIALGAATTAVLNWGPKGDYSRGLNLVTAILVGGVAGEGVGQVVANISAPYLANAIGDYFAQPGHQNETAQLLSHAVLGAVLAVANGGSAAAGAGAGASGELAAQVISRQLYPDAYDANGNFHPEKLDANQLNTVIALSTAVGAFVGGVTGGSVLNA
eukprot:gene19117-19480_t